MNIYESFAKFANASFAKAILGQTSTTEGTPGKLGAEEERAKVRRDILEADAKALSRTVRAQVVWPMVGYNFGWDKPIPNVIFLVAESEDLEKLSRVHKNLVEMDLKIPTAFMRKKYGIPEPEGDEEVLTRPEPAQPTFGVIKKKGIKA